MNTSTVVRHREEAKKPSAPASGAAAGRETWLTPYLQLHAEILGAASQAPAGPMAAVFRRLERAVSGLQPQASPEQVRAIVLTHQRHYLENLISRGGAGFLSYQKFAATFGQWARKPATGAFRPTAAGGKDYTEGMAAIGRGKATRYRPTATTDKDYHAGLEKFRRGEAT